MAEEIRTLVKEAIGSGGFTVPGEYNITIKQNKPDDVFHPTPIEFEGIIDSPLNFLEQRAHLHDLKQCHIEVDRARMTLKLITEETDKFKNVITGRLSYDELFLRLGINDGKYVTAMELSERLRRHKAFFETLAHATEIVNKLKNFKAKVNNTIEKANDNRGNRTDLTIQAIESINLPENFILKTPIFKGQPIRELKVEVDVKPEDLSVTLFSEDAYNTIDDEVNRAIDQVLVKIIEKFPGLLIMEK